MNVWKRNLTVCWFGIFMTAIGMSQIAPVLPLYINELGVNDTALVEQLSGIAFGGTFIISAIFSPIWGKLADKVGRKPMLLRASLGMAIVIFSMGFAHNVYQLIILRLLQGVITGYTTACTTLIATQSKKENVGFALGTLSTASISGSLIGPVVGGYFQELIGLKSVFILTGILMLLVFITTFFFVVETFEPSDEKVQSFKEIWNSLPNINLIITMFITSFMLALGLYSIEPIVTVYISQLAKNSNHIALISGITFSISGLASIISAPRLGKLSDKVGAQKVIVVSLIVAGVLFIPQAFVTAPWQLMGLRFLLGLATAGLMPSCNALVKKLTPDSITGRVFGYSIAAQYLGVFSGSIMGGQVAAYFGIRNVFFITSALIFINVVLVYSTVYKKLNNSVVNI